MELNDFQQQAHGTSHDTMIGGDLLLYPVLGLAGESGELLNKVKKIYRDSGGVYTHADRNAVIAEAMDCAWYIAEICTQLGVNLDDAAHILLSKLNSRADRGVIGGSGDNR
jgi:NTP pyrophosphatase (non-canonical NTP hydrolase)